MSFLENFPYIELDEKAKVLFRKTGINRKKEYITLFPTDGKYEKTDIMQIEKLLNNLSTLNQTNLDEFFKFC